MNMIKPIVAIAGRPNVGKSTFFNRVTRTQNALVDDFPGVTRDRNYGDATWNGVAFTLIDTGGYHQTDSDHFVGEIHSQLTLALADADVIVLLLDGKNGISPYDEDMIGLLRRMNKPVLYAVNKIDGAEKEDAVSDFYRLGVAPLASISSAHGYGVPDFLDDLVAALPSEPADVGSGDAHQEISLALVGRPNVGKSSLINRILGVNRSVVSDMPGTTRDAIDSVFKIGKETYRLIDTAGIRRKGRVSKKIEKFSIIKALRSLDRCHVALIILDASEGITEQDITIAGYACDRGCGCLFVLNKWDIVSKDSRTAKRYVDKLRYEAKFLNFAPVLTVSAKTGLRVGKIFGEAASIYRQHTTRIGTGPLNKIITQATEKTEPSLHHGRRIKFYYATQVSAAPPTFICFVNYPRAVHFSYHRYLVNQIRLETHLDKVPIRLFFRERQSRFRKSGKR